MPSPRTIMAAERRRQAWEWRKQGWPQSRIARELNVSEAAVSKMLKQSLKEWRRYEFNDVSEQVWEQVALLRHIADEALQAWEKSKSPGRRVEQESVNASIIGVPPPPGGNNNVPTKMKTQVTDQQGDPRYLREAREALAEIRQIFGITSASKDQTFVINMMNIDNRNRGTDAGNTPGLNDSISHVAEVYAILESVGAIPPGISENAIPGEAHEIHPPPTDP